MKSIRRRSAILILGLVAFWGCDLRDKQHIAEAQTVLAIMRHLRDYDMANPSVAVTNLSQLFPAGDQVYPHHWHRRFLAFGKTAGFTNSVFEKYVFFQSGITSRWIEGEVVFMNAKPYPGPDGLERSVVSRTASVFHWKTVSEDRVQRLLNESGVRNPIPITAPPPPPEPPPVDAAFRKLAEKNLESVIAEYERQNPPPLWHRPVWQVASVVVLVAMGLTCWWYLRQRKQ